MVIGWIKKRERNEHIKLVVQNFLAASFLADEMSSADSLGLDAPHALTRYRDLASAMNSLERVLVKDQRLPPNHFDQCYQANKILRRDYEGWLYGKKQFAKQFGSVSEKLLNFDQKFKPNEGWEIFQENFERNKGTKPPPF